MKRIAQTAMALTCAALGANWCTAAPVVEAAKPLLDLTFETAPSSDAEIHSQFSFPDFTAGVTGRAWRSDGFSSWISAPLKLNGQRGLTVEAWVALESYPSDAEVPTDKLKPASIINQATRDRGFDLFVDTFGRWGFRISTPRGEKRILAPQPFPLGRWSHVAASFDAATGRACLYLDAKPVGELVLAPGAGFDPATVDVRIARSWQDADVGIFRVNGLNAAFDTVRVYNDAVSAAALSQEAAHAPSASVAAASLAVPASRFATDRQRPVFHAMPSANWTNEPHGLVRRGEDWHIFFQRTPNGPYKTQMHWGHMISRNLVDWTYLPDALWPTLQTDSFGFDMKGVWSGDVVNGPRGIAYAFYTSVNHSSVFNPGISVALSADPDLRSWQKRGPILNADGLRDFRDPYVWQQDGEWRMIVGAALPGKGGGVAYYRCADLADAKCWKKQPRIAPFEKMDIGSDIWEMPVFEPVSEGKYILLANPIGGEVSKYGTKATRAVYWIGRWDGRRFEPDQLAPKFLDILPGHLSPTVARNAAGRLIGIGIVDERRNTQAQKSAGWAHTFSLPRVWRLLEDGKTLGQAPSPELARLRDADRSIRGRISSAAGDQTIGELGSAAEFRVDFESAAARAPYGVSLAASPDGSEVTTLTYDPSTRQFTLDKSKSSLAGTDEGPLTLTGDFDEAAFGRPRSFHVFVDHSVVDVFINDAAAFSFRIYPSGQDSTRFGVRGADHGPARYEGWVLRPAHFTSDVENP